MRSTLAFPMYSRAHLSDIVIQVIKILVLIDYIVNLNYISNNIYCSFRIWAQFGNIKAPDLVPPFPRSSRVKRVRAILVILYQSTNMIDLLVHICNWKRAVGVGRELPLVDISQR